MSDLKHQVVITETGEMVPADDPALALELGAPVEMAAPVAKDPHRDTPGRDTADDPAVASARAEQEQPSEPERVGRGAAGDAPASAEPGQPTPASTPRPAELVPYEPPLDPAHMSLGDIGKVGRVFAASGMFADTTDAAQAVVRILAGQELGIGPFAAMAGIDIIKGKPVLNSNLQRALVQRSSRYAYRVTEWTEERCTMEWLEDGEIVGESSFTMAEAERAGLRGDNWRKYPKAMLLARATSQGARAYAPAIFGGAVYGEGELDG